jgi:dTDP-4-amino-4,6-dideoxy-D-galactose acyltransferase
MTTDPHPGGELCTHLPWDSEFWGFPVARISSPTLTEETLQYALAWSAQNHIRCLYFAADGTSGETLRLAAAGGFRFVDMRVELEKAPLSPAPAVAGIRRATPDDLPELLTIARASHRDTRFFKDLQFEQGRAADLYARWIEQDLRSQVVLVAAAREERRVTGYVTCQLAGTAGRIGLIAVDGQAQGRGVGRALVQASLGWFADHSADHVRVATQATNVKALRLYESAGFMTAEVKAWFHRWFS